LGYDLQDQCDKFPKIFYEIDDNELLQLIQSMFYVHFHWSPRCHLI